MCFEWPGFPSVSSTLKGDASKQLLEGASREFGGSKCAGRAGVVPHYLVGDALTAVATLTATATGQPAAGVLIAFTDGAARARPRARAAAPRGLGGPPPVLTCGHACLHRRLLAALLLPWCTACTLLRQRGSAGRRAAPLAPAIFGVLEPARQLLRAWNLHRIRQLRRQPDQHARRRRARRLPAAVRAPPPRRAAPARHACARTLPRATAAPRPRACLAPGRRPGAVLQERPCAGGWLDT